MRHLLLTTSTKTSNQLSDDMIPRKLGEIDMNQQSKYASATPAHATMNIPKTIFNDVKLNVVNIINLCDYRYTP